MWLYIAIGVLLLISAVSAFGPSVVSLLGGMIGGTSKPDRSTLVKSYDAMATGLVDLTSEEKAALTTVWNALGRVK